MGVVYEARQVRPNRLVALKMILAGGYAGAAKLARFKSEAEAIARLQHPNIVQVYEVGEHDGKPFFSLEFCPGGSLDQTLDGTPLPPREAARLVETLARAMHAAHQANVVHRDLKPGNVLLAADGTPKVTDFGLAKKLDDASGPTQSGDIVGTPSYMAPEQAAGKGKEVGPAADLYALGAILYQLLTGRPPFKAATPLETILQVVRSEPVLPRQPNPAMPRDLETVCLKCLHKDPAWRYATAAALADDLRAFREDRPIQARPAGLLERGRKWAKRRPTAAALLAVCVLAVGVLSWFTLRLLEERAASRKANRQRVFAQVEQLRTADPQAVPDILDALGPVREEILPRLRELWAERAVQYGDHAKRMRVGLALLPAEPEAVKAPLVDWLLKADDPREVELVRDALAPWQDELKGALWATVAADGTPAAVRFRALVALARFDPDDPRWGKAKAQVVEPWLRPTRSASASGRGPCTRSATTWSGHSPRFSTGRCRSRRASGWRQPPFWPAICKTTLRDSRTCWPTRTRRSSASFSPGCAPTATKP
jgi:hypothetical protein